MKKIFISLLLIALSALSLQAADELMLNLKPVSKILLQNGKFNASYSRSFIKDKDKVCDELGLAKGIFYKHKKYSYIAGYNGNFEFTLSAPAMLDKVTVETDLTNYSDGKERILQVEYSIDGVAFSKLAPVNFKGGKVIFKHTFNINGKSDRLQIRFSRLEKNGKYASRGCLLLFQNISINVEGSEKKSSAAAKNTNPYDLTQIFPIGPAWGWERTRAYARHAKMELWDFVDNQFKLLREHGCNTVWFVNINGGEDFKKLLTVAEKNNIKVLASSSILSTFYHGISDLESVTNSARQHIMQYGNYPALLAYVLKDEPYVQCLENCSYFYKVFKKYDPKRESIAVVMNRQSPTYIRESKLPVICTDLYYFGDKDSTQILNTLELSQSTFSENLRTLNRNAAMFGKTHWFMGQLFGDVWGKWYFTPDYRVVVEPNSYLHWRTPTCAEATWQLWEALRSGSKGLFMYVMHGSSPRFTPPDKAKPGSIDARYFDRLAKLAKQASTWPGQKLTKERFTMDFHEGWVYPNGKPTPQMTAMGKVFRAVAKQKDFILNKKFADFPVFFTADPQLNISNFVKNDNKRYAIAVNRDVKKDRNVTIYLPQNVSSVKDMISEKTYALKKSKKMPFNEITFELPAGGGTFLEAEFATEHVGMMVCHETFDQHSYHRVTLTKNGKVINFGDIRIDSNRGITMVNSPDTPVCILKNLSGKRANNTFSLNINTAKKAANGNLYCMLEGRLGNVTVKAVHDNIAEVKSNFLHLREENVSRKSDAKSANSITISRNPVSGEAFVIPAGTTALEFYIGDKNTIIDDIYIWFAPNKK